MPINKKSKVNNIITWLHLWLGLVSGIIVVIVSITGCLFVFQKEITEIIHKKELFVTPPETNAKTLPLSVLKEKAQNELGKDHPVNFITAYTEQGRAWEFMAYQPGDPNAITFPGSVKFYQSAFVNPYTGEITGHINYMHNFFVIVKYIHWSLYLSTKYGQPIVGWATLIFVISLITGFIMWLPKRWNKTEKNNAFTVRWKARWKRLNYDLHNVLGFYTIVIALILGFTGLVYSFPWFKSAVYAAGSLSTKPPTLKTYVSDTSLLSAADPFSKAFLLARNKYPNAQRYGINPAATDKGPIVVRAYHQKEVYYDFNTAYFDQYTGEELGHRAYDEMNNGEKLIAMNYDIHVGSIGGLAGKIIAFLVSLVCTSLPITGFIIWWGKKKKKKKPLPVRKRLLEEPV